MSMIDYASTLSAIDAALLGVTSSANIALGAVVRKAVSDPGTALASFWSSMIDDAKTIWIAAANAAFDDAQAAADFITTQAGGTPPASLTFNTYDMSPVRLRVTDAMALAGPRTFLQKVAQQHLITLGAVDSTEGATAYSQAPNVHSTQWLRQGNNSARSFELSVYAAQADAAVFIALVT